MARPRGAPHPARLRCRRSTDNPGMPRSSALPGGRGTPLGLPRHFTDPPLEGAAPGNGRGSASFLELGQLEVHRVGVVPVAAPGEAPLLEDGDNGSIHLAGDAPV